MKRNSKRLPQRIVVDDVLYQDGHIWIVVDGQEIILDVLNGCDTVEDLLEGCREWLAWDEAQAGK
jgi:hypothetical protein